MNLGGSVLVDTNVVVAYFRGDQTLPPRFAEFQPVHIQIGRPIPDNDLRIAAAARQHGLPLATRDGYFAAVPGLKTLAW